MTSAPTARRVEPPRRAPFVFLVVGLLAAGLTALLTLNTVSAAAEIRNNKLQSDSGTTQDQVTQLKIDIAAKQAPGVLAREAAALGMVPDPNPVFLSIAPDGTVTVLGTPVKVPAVAVAPAAAPAAAATPAATVPAGAPVAPVVPSPTPTVGPTSTLPGGVR